MWQRIFIPILFLTATSLFAEQRKGNPLKPADEITFSNRTSSSISVSFPDNSGNPDGYVVLRSEGNVAADVPVDGTSYTMGESLNSSIVAYVGDQRSFNEMDLTPSATYHYAIFPYSDSGPENPDYADSPYLTGAVVLLANEPTEQPDGLAFSAVGATSLTGSFTGAPGMPDGYLVVRKTGPPMAQAPEDGTTYAVGSAIQTGTVVYVGADVSFNETSLTPSTNYHYAIFSYNGSGVSINYLRSAPLTASVLTLAATPGDQPTALTFSNLTSTSFRVNFNEASSDPGGYLVLRVTGAAVTDSPANGTSYSPGSTINGSTVVYSGNGLSFNQSGLTSSTSYYYAVFSFNGSGASTSYLATAPLAGSISTLAESPTAQPSTITFSSRTSTSLTVNFVAASGTTTGYLVLRRAGAAVNSTPADGETYAVGAALNASTVVSSGSDLSIGQTGLTPSTTYHYAVFSYHGSGTSTNYLTASPLTGSTTTLLGAPGAQPSNLIFSSISPTSLTGSFSAAAGNPGYLVLQRKDAAVADVPADGTTYSPGTTINASTVVYSGNSLSFTSSGLTATSTYHYAIFAFSGSGSGTTYLTASPLTGSATTSISAPTGQPTGLTFSAIGPATLNGNFVAATGNPSGYLVLRRKDAPVSDVPVSGTSYTPGGTFNTSAIVSFGASLSFSESGLTAGSAYYYAIFSYNGSGTGTTYLTTSPLTGSTTTLAGDPAGQPGNLTFAGIGTTSLNVNFTAAGGHAGRPYLVLRRMGGAVSDVPQDGVSYLAGNEINGNIVAYVGTGTSFSETNLITATTYHYAIFSFNGSGATANYLTSSPLIGNTTTLAESNTGQPSQLKFSSVSPNGFNAGFSAANPVPSGYLVLMCRSVAPDVDPLDGIIYTQNQVVGITSGNLVTVAFVGNATSFNLTGLTPGDKYYFKIYSYSGSGLSINYVTTLPLTGSQRTLHNAPTTQASAITFSAVTGTSMVMNFTKGNGASRIVVAMAGATPLPEPADGTTYAANPFGTGAGLGTLGSYVVAITTGQTATVTGLAAQTTYHFRVYEFNGSDGSENYLLPPATGNPASQSTPGPGPTITTINPSSGMVGTVVTISGSNFGATPAGSLVKFNTTTAVVTAGNATTITTSVPAGAATGPISIMVGNQTATSALNFVITSVEGPQVSDNTLLTIPAGAPVTVSATITAMTNGTVVVEYRSILTGAAVSKKTLTAESTTYTVQIPAVEVGELGVEYRIVATNSAGTAATPWQTIRVIRESGLTIPYSSFGKSEPNYRIVAVPLELNSKKVSDVFDELGAFDRAKWRIYRYAADQTTELTGDAEIVPGLGYWLIVKDDPGKPINTGPGSTVKAGLNSPFEVDLVAGWNQIGNPYEFNLRWSDVQEMNPGLPGFRKFDGAFVDGTQLDKMEGGFVKVAAAQKLRFPAIKNTSPNSGRAHEEMEPAAQPLDQGNWHVNLTLQHGSLYNRISGFGMNELASDGFDAYDGFNLPRFFTSYVVLNHQKKEGADYYSSDVVHLADDHEWEFFIESTGSESVMKLSWDNSNFGDNTKGLVLWDKERKLGTDMRSTSSYEFNPSVTKSFKVYFGAMQDILEKITVETLALHSLSPNPSPGDVRICFSIPADGPVFIDAFDMLGRKIWSSENSLLKGYNEVMWLRTEGPEVKGIHIVRLRDGSTTVQERVMLK